MKMKKSVMGTIADAAFVLASALPLRMLMS
jgi:hypothetical protein